MLKILLVIGPAFIALFQIGLDYRYHDKRTKVHRRFRFTTEALIVLVAIIGMWVVYDEGQKAFEAQIRADEKIQNLNHQIKSWAGGEGFGFMKILPRSNYLVLLASNTGEFPIYDVTFSLINLTAALAKTKTPMDIETVQEFTTIIQGGNLAPHSTKAVGRFTYGDSDDYAFNIVTDGRNGQTMQELRLAKVGAQWKSASRVRPSKAKAPFEYIYEKVDDGFPLNKDGTVEWYKQHNKPY